MREAIEESGFDTQFRKVFAVTYARQTKSEIDVIAEHPKFLLCFDCKLYGASRPRTSVLRQQAKKHAARTVEFQSIVQKQCVPVIVTLWDDGLLYEEGCYVVPINKLNDFLLNIEEYLEVLRNDTENQTT